MSVATCACTSRYRRIYSKVFFIFRKSNYVIFFFFFFQAEDGIRDGRVTGVQTCALPISLAGEVERRVGVGGVAVVPSDELGGRDRSRAVAARDGQALVDRRAHGVDDGVIARAQLRRIDVGADREIGRASCRERGKVSGGA